MANPAGDKAEVLGKRILGVNQAGLQGFIRSYCEGGLQKRRKGEELSATNTSGAEYFQM